MTVHRMDAIPGKFKGRKAKKAAATPGTENPNTARTTPGAENPNAAKPARQVAEPGRRQQERDQVKK